MKKLALIAAFLMFAGCAHYSANTYHAREYQFRKNTLFIKVYWNIIRPKNGAVTAEGFVEPFSPDNGLEAVQLRLVGLDAQGRIVNSADGMARDEIIESPFYPASPFSITMKLNGKEKDFTITGSYFYFGINNRPPMDAAHIDYIPMASDDM